MTPWIAAALLLPAVWALAVFNSLVRARNRAASAWSQIDVQLKRRHDLIPNLVRVVEGYLAHERETLTAVARARSAAMCEAGNVPGRARAENDLTRSLGSLMAVAEGYPELKAIAAVRDLFEQLATTENRIAFARQHYNDSVMLLNNRVETFPSSLLASMCGFTRKDFFELDDGREGTAPSARPA